MLRIIAEAQPGCKDQIYDDQRTPKPYLVTHIAKKMETQGYNSSYPVTLDSDNGLVDGGHRVEAAQLVGLVEVPFILMMNGTNRIQHAIRCNEDGTDTSRFDVFDYAELCWKLSQNMTGEQIANELGWGSDKQIIQYKNIKDKLHPLTWDEARGVTKKVTFVTNDDSSLVTNEVTIVTWKESHFRSILAHIGLDDERNNALMRAQLKVIREAYKRATPPKERQVTAKWLGEIAEAQAWQV